jgi:MFS family permease
MRDFGAGKERSFGLSVGGAVALLAAYSAWRGRATAAAVGGLLAALLIGPALTAPSLLRVPSALWWRFARLLGWFNSLVLLSVAWVLVFTPLGALMRLAGRDPLARRRRATATGWLPYAERQRDPKHYERMY